MLTPLSLLCHFPLSIMRRLSVSAIHNGRSPMPLFHGIPNKDISSPIFSGIQRFASAYKEVRTVRVHSLFNRNYSMQLTSCSRYPPPDQFPPPKHNSTAIKFNVANHRIVVLSHYSLLTQIIFSPGSRVLIQFAEEERRAVKFVTLFSNFFELRIWEAMQCSGSYSYHAERLDCTIENSGVRDLNTGTKFHNCHNDFACLLTRYC